MKKSFVSLLTIAAITFGMVSCNSSKKQDAAEQKVEEEAAIAGEVSKGLLTAVERRGYSFLERYAGFGVALQSIYRRGYDLCR